MSIIVERFWTFHEAFLQKLMKSLVCVFHVYILHQMNALKKLREMLFILPKKLFSLSRYSHFCIFPFPFFPPVYHCLDYRKNVEKCFLFDLKSSFHSRGIQIFVFPSSPLFFTVSHCFRRGSKINLKVYEVIHCLNKNLITDFVLYLEKGKRYATETFQFIEY